MFRLFKINKANYTNWKIVSVEESLGWVTIIQSRENTENGFTQFKSYKVWVNSRPEAIIELRRRLI